nr:N-acetylglucosamine-specific PTS transporter subunit IIBC [Tissierella sp.]
MKDYLQRIGRSLMLPVAVLPAAAILMGIGYWIDPSGWGGDSATAAFLIKAGSAIIDNMAILFAVGVALGMSKDKHGAAALSGLVGYLVVTTLLSTGSVSMLKGIEVEAVNPAFAKIGNQFIGILSGAISAVMYNKFSGVKLPDALAFFSGKRLAPIMSAVAMVITSLPLFFVWPIIYSGLVGFGKSILSLGALGAGIYGFANRLLIPVGLHHALNSVFWFDVAGINDINNFWGSVGERGVTGMYQAGFFPIMMFGLVGAALAMYHTAKPENKKQVGSLMLAAGFASFFTGVTEPLEFSFMFVAPALYVVHAALTGVSLFISASMQWIAGFGFSAGFVDWFLSLRMPLAVKPYMLIAQGLVFAAIYYFLFRFMITKFNLKTPGREGLMAEDDDLETVSASSGRSGAGVTGGSAKTSSKDDKFKNMADIIYIGLGGADNITDIDNCVTRLRIKVKDMNKVDQAQIKRANIAGVNVIDDKNIQVIVGPQVQFVADEMRKI